MNHTYRVVFNETTGTYVAVAEIMPAKGKKSKSSKTAIAAAVAALAGVSAQSQAAVVVGATSATGAVQASGATATGNSIAIGSGAISRTTTNANVNGEIVIGAGARGDHDLGNSAHVWYFNPESSSPSVTQNNTPLAGVRGGTGAVFSSVVVVGQNAKADGGGVAVGDRATVIAQPNAGAADGTEKLRSLGVAIGANAMSRGGGVVIGASAETQGINSIAMGRQAVAKGEASQAFGVVSAAVGNGSLAMGQSATSRGDRSIAIGMSQSSEQYNSTTNVQANGTDSIAIGSVARSESTNSIAIGKEAKARNYALSLTAAPTAPQNTQSADSIAVGTKATSWGNNTIAIGHNAKTVLNENTQAGQWTGGVGTNHVFYGSPYSSMGKSKQTATAANEVISATEGDYTSRIQSASISIGHDSSASGGGVALGSQATVTRNDSGESRTLGVAIGANALSRGGGVVVGSSAETRGINAVAVGRQAVAQGSASQAYGVVAAAVGNGSLAMGQSATSLGERSIAIGMSDSSEQYTNTTNVYANGTDSIAMGSVSRSNTNRSVAIGPSAKTLGLANPSTVVNDSGTKRGGSQIAIGDNATTGHINTAGAVTTGQDAIAIGTNASTVQSYDITIGGESKILRNTLENNLKNASVSGRPASVAMGYSAVSQGVHGDTIIGSHARNNMNNQFAIAQSTAIGSRAVVYGDQAMAFGADTSAIGNASVAIGGDDIDKASAALQAAVDALKTQDMQRLTTIGSRLSTQMGNQTLAANLLYGANVNAVSETARYIRTTAAGDASIAMGATTQALGVGSVAQGVNAITFGNASIAQGVLAHAGADNSIASGSVARTSAEDAIAIGHGAKAGGTVTGNNVLAENNKGQAAIAIGLNAEARGNQSISVGVGNIVTGDNSGAFGDPSYITGNGSYSVGNNNTVTTDDTFVLGSGVNRKNNLTTNGTGTVANSVYLGKDSEATAGTAVNTKALTAEQAAGTTTTAGDKGTVSEAKVGDYTYGGFAGATANGVVTIGASGSERRLQNVAAGEISATSTDAINGSQLYAAMNRTERGWDVLNGADEVKGKVTPGDQVKFVAGDGVKVDVADETEAGVTTITISSTVEPGTSVANTNLTVNDNGSVVVPDANNNGGSYVNATSLAEAINKTGWNVTSGVTGTGKQEGKDPVTEQINPGDEVKLQAGNGLSINQDGSTFTYSVATGSITTADNKAVGDTNNGNVATVGDVVNAVNNAAWELQENGAKKDDIKAGDIVNFANGTGTTVKINTVGDTSTVQVDVATSPVTFTDGTATATTPNAPASSGDVANVTNAAVTHLTEKGLNFVGNDGTQIHKDLGQVLTVKGGMADGAGASDRNTYVQNVDGNLVVKISDTPTFNNITLANGGNTVTLNPTDTGLTLGNATGAPVQINNVAPGTKGTDAVNLDQLNSTKWSLNTSANGGTAVGCATTEVGNSTVTLVAGKGIKSTQEGTTITLEADVDTTVSNTNLTVNDNGSVAVPDVNNNGGSYVNATSLAEAINKTGWNVTSGVTGTGKQEGKDPVTEQINPGDEVKLQAGNGLSISQDGSTFTYSVATGSITTADNKAVGDTNNGNVATVGDVVNAVNNAAWELQENGAKKDDIKAGDIVNFANGTGTTVKINTVGDTSTVQIDVATSPVTFTDGTATATTPAAPASSGDVANVTNAAVTHLTEKGLNFVGNDGTQIHKDLGQVLTVKGGMADGAGASDRNTYVQNVDGNLVVKISDTPTFNNITLANGGNTVTLNPTDTGLTLGNATGAPVQINNVAPGTKGTDAVNLDQLNSTKWSLNTSANGGTAVGCATTEVGNSTVTLVAGKGIKTTQAGTTITLEADVDTTVSNTNLTVNDNGSVAVPDVNNNGGSYVNATSLAEAINKTGWNVTSGVTGTGKQEGKDPVTEQINPGDEVKLQAGNGLSISQDGSTFTYSVATGSITTADNKAVGDTNNGNVATVGDVVNAVNNAAWELQENSEKRDDVKAGDTVNFVNGQGTVVNITSKDGVSEIKFDTPLTYVDDAGTPSTTPSNTVNLVGGNTSAPVTLGNLKGADVYNADNAPRGDTATVGLTNLTSAPATQAATVGDLQNMGWVVAAKDGDYAEKVQNADRVEFVGKGVAKVTGETVDNVRTITVEVEEGAMPQQPVVYTNAAGDRVYKQEDGSFNTQEDGSGTTVQAGDVIASMNDGSGNTTAPMTLSNVKGNLVEAPNDGTATSTPADNSPTSLADKKDNAATVGDVLNAGWNLQENGEARDTVTHADTVNFVNGQGTVVNITSKDGVSEIKFDTPLTYVDDAGTPSTTPSNTVNLVGGNTSAPVTLGNLKGADVYNADNAPRGDTATVGLTNLTSAPATQAATVGDLQNMGWVVAAKDGDYAEKVQNADRVEFVGKGVAKVTGETVDNVRTITVEVEEGAMPQQPVVYTNAAGDRVYKQEDGSFNTQEDGSGTTVQAGDVIASMNDGSGNTTAPMTLSNVKGNLVEAPNDGTATSTPADNSPTSLADKKDNAATVGDVLNAGWNLQENGEARDTVTHADTVNFVNGQGTVVNITSKDGVSEIKFDTPLTYVDDAGTPSTTPSNTVNLVGGNTSAPVTLGNLKGADVYNADNAPRGDTATVGLTNLTSAPATQAATVGDLQNMGWVVAAKDGDYAEKVQNADRVEFVGKGVAKVTGETVDNVRTITVEVEEGAMPQQPVVYTNAAGDRVYKQEDGSFNTQEDGSGTTVQAGDVIASMNDGSGNTTAPMTLSNVKGNLVEAPNDGTATSTPADNSPTSLADKKDNAATVGDVLNAGWNLQENGEARDTVTHADTVNFVNGQGTVVNITSKDGVSEIKFDTPLTYVDDAGTPSTTPSNTVNLVGGNTSAPVTLGNLKGADVYNADNAPRGDTATVGLTNLTSAPATQAATVGDLQNMGWVVAAKDGDYAEKVQNADRVEFVGKGVAKVTGETVDNVRTITVEVEEGAMPQQPVVYTNAAGDRVYKQEDGSFNTQEDGSGTTVQAGDVIASMNDGSGNTTAPMTLSNVKGNLVEAPNDGTATSTPADNSPTSLADKKDNAATVGDVLNAGWNLQENGEARDTVTHADTVNFVNGQGTVVNITSKDGVSEIKFDTPLTYVDDAGTPSTTPSNTVNLVGGNTSAPVTLGNLKGADVYNADNAPRGDTATVGLTNLTSAPATQAATVGDLQNMGWVVAAKDGDYAEKVQNADRVEFVGKGVAKVTGETVDNVRTITVEVEEGAMPQQPVVYTNAAGDRVYKQEDGSFNTQEDGSGTTVQAGDVIASMNDGSGNTTAPMTLSNVKGNLVEAPNDGTATSTPADNSPTSLADKKDNAATVGDVLNAGWNLQENGEARDTVTHADTVNFVNGQGTVVNITSKDGVSEIKFDTPLTYVDDAGTPSTTPSNTVNLVGGNTSAPVTLGNLKGADVYNADNAPRGDTATVGLTNLTSAPATQAATVGDLQNMGWVVAAKDGDYAEKVQNADRVEFVGKGVAKVTGETVDNVRTITVEVEEGAMPQQPVVYTNAAGDRVYKQEDGSFNTQEDGSGTTVQAGDVIASMNDGSGNTTAPMTLSNVKGNLVEAPNDGTATSTPADNSPTSLADKKDNAATVGDVLNAGWNLQENGEARDTVTHADTVNFVNGQGTVVNITSKDGVSEIKFDTPLTYVDDAGTPSTTPSNTVNLVGGNTSAPVTLGNLKGADVYNADNAPRGDTATVGLTNLTSAPATQAATVGDLQNMGWVVAAKDGDYAEKVQNADRVEFVGKGVAKVTGETVDNVRTITVEVEEGAMPQQPVVYTNAAGDRVYKQEDGSFNTQEDGSGTTVQAGDVIASMNDGSGNTTAPMTLSNVKGNLVEAPNDGTATSTPADNSPTSLADKKDNAATVGDVLNAGWNLQENGEARDTVTHADTVNFVNGQGTVVNITSKDGVSEIKFDTPLTYVDDAGTPSTTPSNTVNLVGGNTSAPVTLGNLKGADVYNADNAPRGDTATVGLTNLTSAPATQAATVGDLQNMGWVVAAKDGDYAEKVQNADRVEFVGKGVAKVTGETVDNVRTITVEVEEGAMPQQPVVYTNAAGDRVYKQEDGSFNTQEDGSGTTVQAGDVIASMNDGSGNTTAPMTLSNVKGNLVEAPNDGTATSTPADNSPTSLADKKDNAATVGDVLNAGWNLQENGEARDTVTHADTVNFVNGQGTVVNITSKDGVSEIKFDTPLTYVDDAGTPSTTPSNTVNLVGGNTSAPVTLGNLKGADVYNADNAPRGDTATVGLTNLTSAPATQAATVGDLQNMGWVVAAKDGDYAEKVQNADRVEFVGKGVAKVTGETVDNVRTITVEVEEGAMPQQPVVYTNAAGDRVYKQEDGSFNTQEDGSGTTVQAGDVIASMNDGSGNTTAPMTLSNVKGNLVEAPNDGTATSTPADNSPTSLADKKDNAATVGDVLNAGWNLQENGEARDTVTHADTVNFVNGQGTVVNITSKDGVSEIKFDTPLTYVDDAGTPSTTPSNTVNLVGGNTSAPVTLGNLKGADVYNADNAPRGDTATVGLTNLTSAPATQAATVGDLQNMGWVVAAKDGDYAEKVQNADRVEFVGKGVAKVTGETVDNVRTITVEVEEGAMPQQPVVYTNAAGDRVYKQEDGSFNTQEDGSGTTVQAGDVIASMNDGSGNTTAPMTLSNVKGNLVEAPNDGTATSTPADNSPTSLADKKDNAATVGDVLNAGWNLQENGEARDTVTHADTVNFVNGQGTVVNITSKDGVSEIKFDTPLTYVDDAGTPSTTPSNTVNLVGGNTSAPVTLGNLKGADVYNADNAPRGDTATVGLTNLTSAPATQAATVGDLQNMGWVVAAKDGDYAEKVQNADRVEFVGKGVAKVTGETVDNVRTITVEVEEGAMPQQPVVYTNAAGDRVYKQEDGSFNTQEDGSGTTVQAGDVIASMNDGSGNTTAPMTLSNVKGNLVEAPNDGTATSTPADNSPTSLADKKDNAATVGDVLNAGWNLQENGEARDTVTHADTVNFVNGQGTVVNITSKDGVSEIKFDTPLTYVDDAGTPSTTPSNTVNLVGGNTSAPVTLGNLKGADVYNADNAPRGDTATVGLTNLTSAPATQAATVGDLQNMGWVVAAKDGDYAEKVQNADRVEFVGKGVAKVTGETVDNVRTITVEVEEGAMPQQPVVYTNAAGDRVYKQEDGSFNTQEDGSGTTVQAGDVIASMNDGSGNTTAPMTLSNVKGNLVEAPNDGTATSTPADNSPTSLADKKDNAATVGDVLNAGWNLQENGEARDTVTHADTVNFVNGQGTVVNITSKDGVSEIKFDTPLTYVDDAGTPSTTPSNTVNLVGGNTSAPVTLGNLKGADTYNASTAPRPDAVGLTNLTSAPATQAATVGDLQNMGWVVGTPSSNFTNQVKNANRVDFVGVNGATVTGEVNATTGINTITVDVQAQGVTNAAQLPVVYTTNINGVNTPVYLQPDNTFNTAIDGKGTTVEAGDVIASMNSGDNSTAKPTTLNNVKGNLVEAPNDGTATSTPAANAPANLTNAMNNAATVGDVLNAGWNLQENGEAKDTVTHADTVNFVNGQGTNVNITTVNGTSEIKFDTPLTYVDDAGNATNAPSNTVNLVGGNTSAPVTLDNLKGADTYNASTAPRPDAVGLTNLTSAPATQAATVGDLQNMGWVVGTPSSNFTNQVKNANRVDFVGVNGATVTGEVNATTGINTITVDVQAQGVTNAAQLPVVYTTNINGVNTPVYLQPDNTFNTAIDGKGTTVEAGDVIASMNSGDNSTAKPTTLNNVKGNLVEAPNDGTATSTPAANAPANLTNAMNNAATVGDVLNAGWNLQENGTAKDTVTHADTVNFVNGQGTNVNITTVNGTSEIKFDTPLTYVDDAGNATNAPSNTVNLVGGNTSAPVTLGNLKGADTYNASTAPRPDAVGLTNLTSAPATQAATVGDLQNMGWVVGTPSSNFTNQVKNANRVDFVGVNGATVTGEVNATTGINTITVDVQAQGVTNAAQLPVVYTTNINGVNTPVYLQPDNTFNTAIDGKGTTVEAGDVIASMNSGDNSTAKPTTLNNVKGNLVEAPNDGTATSTPAANAPANLTNAMNNAATVGDVLNAGWNLQENGEAKDTVTHADTVNFVNGQGTNVNITTVNGTSEIKFDTPLTYVDDAGNATNAPSNTVNLVGGNTSAPVTLGNLKGADTYNASTAPRPDAVGLTNLTSAPATQAATVGDLQNMGWVVGTPSSNFTNQVKNANRVDFVGVNGATVTGEVNATTGINTITVDVQAQGVTNAAQLPVVYTTNINGVNTPVYLQPDNTFNTAIDGKGTTVEAGDVIASMNSGDNSTAKPTTLNNVKGNLVEAPNDGTATSTPAANAPANLTNAMNNAATVGDVLNAGWNLQENGEAKDTVTHADTVNFVNGQGTNVNITTVNGTSEIKFDTPLTYVDDAGNATNVPSNTVSFVGGNTSEPVTVIGATSGLTPSSISTMPTGNTGSPVTNQLINFNSPANTNIDPTTVATVGDLRNLGWVVSAAGNNYSDAVKSADQVEFVGEGGVNVTGVTKDGKRIITITGGGNGGSVVAGDNVHVEPTTTTGPNGTTSTTYNVSAPSVGINANGTTGTAQFTSPTNTTGLVKAGDVIDTINNVSWNSTTDKVGTGEASTTGNTSVKAGDTVTYTAGNNMNLTQDGKNLTIATKDNVTFNTMNATNVNVSPAGNLTVGGNATVDMGNNRVLNVAAGELNANSTDAVNGSQLYQIYQVVGGNNQNVSVTNGTSAPVTNTTTGGTTNQNVTLMPVSPGNNITVIGGDVNNTPISNNYTMVTYNVEGQKNYITNNVIEAIGRMNEQGIQFFHTNDGTGKPRAIQGANDVDSSASGAYATAIGHRAEAAGENSIALGRNTKALGIDSISIGNGNIVIGKGSGAFGDPSTITGNASYVMGNDNTVATDKTFVVGNNVTQVKENSVFLGDTTAYSYATGTNATLISAAANATKALTAAGVAEGEAVAVQENAVKTKTEMEAQLAAKTAEEANIRSRLASGEANVTQATLAAAVQATANASRALDNATTALNTANTTLTNAKAALANATTVSTAANRAVVASEEAAVANSIATNTGRTAGSSKALTSQNVAGLTEDNKFAGGNQTVGVVSVGSDTETRRIQNVAPGLLSEESTDAINGSQLYAVAGSLNNKIDKNAARTVTVNKVDPSTVANATSSNGAPITGNQVEFADGVGTSVNVLNDNGRPIIIVNTTNTYLDSNGVATTSPTNVVQMVGKPTTNAEGQVVNNPVSITNVASGVATINEDGSVTEILVGDARTAAILNTPRDDVKAQQKAVNVGDLYSVGNTLNQKIDEVDELASAGTAAAMATAGLPQVYLPGKSMVAVAGSTYRGKQGYAVGFSAITDGGNWIVKGSVSGHSKGKFGATVGAGYQW